MRRNLASSLLILCALALASAAGGQSPLWSREPSGASSTTAADPKLPSSDGTALVRRQDPAAEERKPAVRRRRHFLLRPWLLNRPETRRLWLGTIPLAVGLFLDCHSTALVGRRNPGSVETNPFLPAHPTNGQIAAYCGTYFIGQLYAQEALRSYSRGIERSGNRVTDYLFTGGGLVDGYSVGVGALHGWAGKRNYDIVTCPGGFFKPPGQPGCVRR